MYIHLVHYQQTVLAMLTKKMNANLGIMITASHNPFYDNGLKLFGPDGLKLSDKIEKNRKTYRYKNFKTFNCTRNH